MNENQFNSGESIFENVVYAYTSDEAVNDGILFDVTAINSTWKKGLFNYVTVSLLRNGYMDEKGQINIANLIDLLNQVNQIVRRESKDFTVFDSFFSGAVELPNGNRQKVFMGQNETGKFTIMLPEDY